MGPEEIRALARPEGIVFDVKHVMPPASVEGRL
jgi:hypothetical protein